MTARIQISPPARQSGQMGEYFYALDGFRGVLAVCVAIYHTIWLTNFNAHDFFNHGPVLIDLFFVFSGFLMFRLYGQRIRTMAQAKQFIWRRIARLYPVHLFMTLVFLGFAILRLIAHAVGIASHEPGEILPFSPGAQDGWFSLLTNLTLTHSMGVHDSLTFNPPSWTISVEFWAYFTFCALLMLKAPQKLWHFALLAIGVAGLYVWLSQLKPNMDFHYDYGFFRCLAGFYTGVIICWLYGKCRDSVDRITAHDNLAVKVVPSLIELATLCLFVGFVINAPGKIQFLFAPFAALFVFVFAFDKGLVTQFLKLAPFRYLARISYSLYMVHVIISVFFGIFAEQFMPRLMGEDWNATKVMGDILLIPYLIAVVPASHIVHRFVEVPGRKWMLARNPFGTQTVPAKTRPADSLS